MKILKNSWKKLKRDISERIRIIKRDHLVREYFKNNILFLTFVITGVLNSTILRFLCMHSVENYLSWKAVLADTVVVSMIGAFGYLLKPKDRFAYYFGFCLFLTGICMVNSVYYTFYTSFASVSMLSLTQYIGDVGDAVVENVLQLKDLIYVIAPLILIGIHLKLKKKNYYKRVELKSERRKRTFKSLSVTGALLVIFLVTLSSLDVSRFFKQWNKEYIVMRFGIYVYQANDLVASVQPKVNSMFGYDKASREFNDYFANVSEKPEANQYTNIFEGKNVIVIHAESMMTNVIGLRFNDQEVTPTLNRLSQDGMYFSNFYSQVSVGTSSDSELTYNTSLMPTKSGTAFVSYSNREYIGIPTLLNEKGYYTFSMHANNADFWNRRAMHKNLGYQRFYSKVDYKVDKENMIGLGLSDKEFFKQSVDKIEKINQKHDKWYGLLIMLTNHTPFSEVDKYGEFPVDIKETITNEDGTTEEVSYPYMEGTKLGNYFKSIHYADSALGEFIDGLDERGLLDNTVFVLYGDHDARLPKKDYNRLYNYNKETDSVLEEEDPNYRVFDSYQYELGRKVPFIIWTKNMKDTSLNFENSNVMGMYDVVPTLGNMFGFYNKYALGHDIYNIREKNIVVFPNGNWVNNNLYYNSQKAAYLPLTETPISEEEIAENTEYTNKLLDVSNNIIVFDLLNEDKNKELKEVSDNK
ncbi:MAG: sulfatase-like hydrolase/transferase [Bacilli bacterium]|nr:sulfatase-like hydrolase/transferase [Bacilli bacterium]